MRNIILTVLFSILTLQLFAQNVSDSAKMASRLNRQNAKRERMNNMLRMEEEGDLIFNKHNVFGIRLATNGYGINFEKGKFISPTKTRIYQFELNEVHDPKEHHVSASTDQINFSSVNPYKINNLYEFKMAMGEERLIGGKGNKNGVAVSVLYTGGVTIGFLKPYYLDVTNAITSATTQETFAQLNQDTAEGQQIQGAAGFFSGWDALKIQPALNAKLAMRFDYGRLNQTISAIECGLTEEYYFSKVPLVYMVKEHNFFFNAYVQIMFGSRK